MTFYKLSHQLFSYFLQDLEFVTVQESSTLKIINNMKQDIEAIEKIIIKESNIKHNKNQFDWLIRSLKEECSNIEVVSNDEKNTNNTAKNLKLEIKTMIEEIKSQTTNENVDISMVFNKNTHENYYFDNKLIVALRLIILCSIKYNENPALNIIVEEKNNNLHKTELEITVENIKFGKDREEIENAYSLLSLKSVTAQINDCRIDPDLFIIRQNLLRVADKVKFMIWGRVENIVINLTLERVKKNRKKICALIVDDNKPTAKLNQEVLKDLDIDSVVVLSGKECIEKIISNYDDFDIIFTDNQMPHMDGTELIQKLHQIEGFNLPVVIVTGNNNENNFFQNRYGFNDYIQKPLTKLKVEKTIKKLINRDN